MQNQIIFEVHPPGLGVVYLTAFIGIYIKFIWPELTSMVAFFVHRRKFDSIRARAKQKMIPPISDRAWIFWALPTKISLELTGLTAVLLIADICIEKISISDTFITGIFSLIYIFVCVSIIGMIFDGIDRNRTSTAL